MSIRQFSHHFLSAAFALYGVAAMYSCSGNEQRKMQREWQSLNDTIAFYSRKISNITATIQQGNTTTTASQEHLLHDIDSIDQLMKRAIRETAERNKDNELGQFIRENYTETSY